MPLRSLVAAAAAALAIPLAAHAQPSRFQLTATIAPGQDAVLTIGTVPRGEFVFAVRAGSDDVKRLLVTQQRNGGRRFTVFRLPGGASSARCQGAAGTIGCTGITTPATPGGHTWTFHVVNQSRRPTFVTLTVVWRRVASAG
jgi:hypothetical protein